MSVAAMSLVAAMLLSACNTEGSTTESTSSTPPTTASTPGADIPSPVTTSPSPAEPGSAPAAVDQLRVAGRGPLTGYARSLFGAAWLDVDRNGCDTRNDVLARDLVNRSVRPGTRGCVIVSGLRNDPYTGTRIVFERGGVSELDIDHVVPLANAWVSGAARWNYGRRVAFANDPLNLLAVDAAANRQKGAGDAATWLPANKPYRCSYVARQVAVKLKFGLSVTQAEKEAMVRVLSTCPSEPLPTGGGTTESTLREPSPAPTSAGSAARPSGSDPRFTTCKTAIEAGFGPYVQGRDPEYAWYRDANSNGIVCE